MLCIAFTYTTHTYTVPAPIGTVPPRASNTSRTKNQHVAEKLFHLPKPIVAGVALAHVCTIEPSCDRETFDVVPWPTVKTRMLL